MRSAEKRLGQFAFQSKGRENLLPDIEKKNKLKLSPSHRVFLMYRVSDASREKTRRNQKILTHYAQSAALDSQYRAAYWSTPTPDSSIPTPSSPPHPAPLHPDLHARVPRVHGHAGAAVSVPPHLRSDGSSVLGYTTLQPQRRKRRGGVGGSESTPVRAGPVVSDGSRRSVSVSVRGGGVLVRGLPSPCGVVRG